jgi:hypothetical protein
MDMMGSIRGTKGERIDFMKIIPCPLPFDDVPFHVELAVRRELGLTHSNPIIAAMEQENLKITPSIEELSEEDQEKALQFMGAYDKYGCFHALDWCRTYWGTKWNAYETPTSLDTDRSFRFDTAWSTPMPVFEALAAQWPDLKFRISYADEDIGSNCGVLIFSKGVLVAHDNRAGRSEKARRFARRIKYAKGG